MRLLLDTHVAIWWLHDGRRIPATAHEQIGDPDNDGFISVASLWEISIKRQLGKLNGSEQVRFGLAQQGFVELQITGEHALTAGALPLHHRDPFDRMLVAQARIEKLTVVTADRRFAAYGVATLW